MPAITGELREATLQAERYLLGAILINSELSTEAIDYCRPLLQCADFLDYQYKDPDNIHSRIYRAMLQCQKPNRVTAAYKMFELDILRDRDITYLIGLTADCPCSLAYDDFSKTVKDYCVARQGNILIRAKVIEI